MCRLSQYGEISGSVTAIDEQIVTYSIEITLRPAKILLEKHGKHSNIAKRDPKIKNAFIVHILIIILNGNGVITLTQS